MKRLKIFIILIILVIILLILSRITITRLYPLKYEDYVEKYSKEYNIDSFLIYAIIKEESNFNENAGSHKGAIGLMQLMKDTGEEVGYRMGMKEVDLVEPETNIMIGTKYLSELIDTYDKNINLAIVAYNAGSGNVNKWIKDGIINKDGSNLENTPYKETNMYLRKVLRDYEIYRKLY